MEKPSLRLYKPKLGTYLPSFGLQFVRACRRFSALRLEDFRGGMASFVHLRLLWLRALPPVRVPVCRALGVLLPRLTVVRVELWRW